VLTSFRENRHGCSREVAELLGAQGLKIRVLDVDPVSLGSAGRWCLV
jgi:hypothetical protein